MQRDLNIRQIEVFKAMMECKTTVAASERLNISQPTISSHLAALEHETSLVLFERNKNRLIPTPEAEAFYEEISRVYMGLDHLKRFTDGLKNEFRGRIHFGAMPMVSYGWMPRLVGDFIEKNSDVSISMPVRSSRQLLEWIAADRLDFCIVHATGRYAYLEAELLLRLPVVCLMPRNSDLAAKDHVSIKDLDQKNIIKLRSFDIWSASLEEMLDMQENIKPCNLVETFNTQTAARIAKACSGYALIDLMTALEEVDITTTWRPLEEKEELEIHLVCSKRNRLSEASRCFLDLIRKDARKLNEHFEAVMNTNSRNF